jgi:hypothetical protein
VAVRLVDPLELALPDIGLLPFEDAESGEQMSSTPRSRLPPALRRREPKPGRMYVMALRARGRRCARTADRRRPAGGHPALRRTCGAGRRGSARRGWWHDLHLDRHALAAAAGARAGGAYICDAAPQEEVLRYANLPLVKQALGKGMGWRRHVPPLLLLAAMTVLIVAVARPAAVSPSPRRGPP